MEHTEEQTTLDGATLLTGSKELPAETVPPEPQGEDPLVNPEQEASKYDSRDWRSSLPDDIRDETTLEKFTTTEGLARSYVNLERRLGDHLPVPKTDADLEEVYAKLGRPEAPEKYEFEALEYPDGMTHDKEGEDYFRQVVHKAGLSPKQAQQLYKDYFGLMAGRHIEWQKAQTAARDEAQRALQRQYGASYDGEIARAKSTLQQYATPEFLKRLDQTGMGNDPEMIRVFAKIGGDLGGETSLMNGMAQRTTPADAASAVEDYRAKHMAALYDKDHPEHQVRTRELWKLTQQAFPEHSA